MRRELHIVTVDIPARPWWRQLLRPVQFALYFCVAAYLLNGIARRWVWLSRTLMGW